jgi:hypothetical protein
MRRKIAASAVLAVLAIATATGADNGHAPQFRTFANPTGMSATYSTGGALDLSNPFFQKLGMNGRSCDTCHQPADGWTITPASVQRRFRESDGTDPIFRLNDGANSPLADISTVDKRRAAFSMLLDKGLIRVGIGIPADAEFELADADDPYGFASTAELSLFRRPLPSANLKFLNTVMWDGRETFTDDASSDCIRGTTRCFASLHFNLSHQSNAATQGHAQAPEPLTPAQREAIVRFEMGLFSAQAFDNAAKSLTADGASGGPVALASQDSYFGINDVLAGDYRTGASFDPIVLRAFEAWSQVGGGENAQAAQARLAIVRGQALFNTKTIHITGVKGINDDLGIGDLPGSCTTCHDAPGAGNHSIPMPLDIGLTDTSRATPDMPLYLLRNKATGETRATTDPGRALVTGKWKDIGRFKGPTLRSLASRAPYFHNGSAASLRDVVDFYDQRFSIGLTAREKADLVAFLQAL